MGGGDGYWGLGERERHSRQLATGRVGGGGQDSRRTSTVVRGLSLLTASCGVRCVARPVAGRLQWEQ